MVTILQKSHGKHRYFLASLGGMGLLLLDPAPVQAGMPTILLNEMARMRIQTISFFLIGILLSSGLIQLVWNGLRKDFSFLPRLSYGKALGVVVLWGLLFVLVLTMIAGARELMTPGAWEKRGITYRLAEPPSAPSTEDYPESTRQKKLESLRAALWEYAATHEGKYPLKRSGKEIPEEKWQVPDASGMRYLYVGGRAVGRGVSPLAYEPEIFGARRLVLFTNGDIRQMDNDELDKALGMENR